MAQRTVEDLINIGTPKALEDAFLQIQSEVGCNPVNAHPLYSDWEWKTTGMKWKKSETVVEATTPA